MSVSETRMITHVPFLFVTVFISLPVCPNSVIQTYWGFPTQMGISEALVHILLSHVTYITNTPCIIKALLIITFVMSDSVCLTVQMEYRKK